MKPRSHPLATLVVVLFLALSAVDVQAANARCSVAKAGTVESGKTVKTKLRLKCGKRFRTLFAAGENRREVLAIALVAMTEERQVAVKFTGKRLRSIELL